MADRSVDLATLRTLGTVEEAEKHVLDQCVDGVMATTVSWTDWLSARGQLGFTPASLSYDPDGFVEIFQRRNVHLHANGRVKVRYLKVVTSPDPVGTYLPITREYLADAIENLLCVGVLLAGSVAKFLNPKTSTFPAIIVHFQVDEEFADAHQ